MAAGVVLHFQRADPETPWGFRLVGGQDFGEPLTVIKVCEGSVAETVGMKVGDVLVQINDVTAHTLTHAEAHDVILEGKCNFTIEVQRGKRQEEETCQLVESINGENGEIEIYPPEAPVSEPEAERLQKESDLNITDEEIVQIIQGEQQLAQTEVTASSEILKIIAEAEEQQDSRKWSTFLQKPDKPIRKPLAKELPVENKKPSYQVVIKKQKRRSFESAVALLQEEDALRANFEGTNGHESSKPEISDQKEAKSKQHENTRFEITEDYVVEHRDEEIDDKHLPQEKEEDVEEVVGTNDEEQDEDRPEETETIKLDVPHPHAKKPLRVRPKKEESCSSIEEQLAQVQEQLLALARLPSTIQTTLNAVTRQLEKIASAAQLVQEEEQDEHSYEATTTTEEDITEQDGVLSTVMEEPNEIENEEDENENEKTDYVKEDDDEEGCLHKQRSDKEEVINEGDEEEKEENEQEEEKGELKDVEEEFDDGLTPEEREEMRIKRELEEKKQKDLRVLEEQGRRRSEQRPSGPLAPLERPIILPGGRKWSEPEDACPQPRHRKLSDATISHTIETFSEVLVGRTKGESNCHLVPSKAVLTKKINFLKYQPPPKNLDHLQKSEVYKMIHDMEPPPKGISIRTGKILAAEDYLQESEAS